MDGESCPDPPEAAAEAIRRKRFYFCAPKLDCKTNTVCCTYEKYICKVHSHILAYCPTCVSQISLNVLPIVWVYNCCLLLKK